MNIDNRRTKKSTIINCLIFIELNWIWFVFAECEDRINPVWVLAQPSKFSKGLLAGAESGSGA
jgi:hypothetical protein